MPRHQKRQRKTDSARDQKRAQRIVLHLPGHRLRAVAQRIAAVLVSILGVPRRGVTDAARSVFDLVLGLAVKILRFPAHLADTTGSLGLRIIRHIADRALDSTGKILGRTGNSILIHRVLPLL